MRILFDAISQYKTKAPPLPRLADLHRLILRLVAATQYIGKISSFALGHLLFLKDSSILAIYPIVSSVELPIHVSPHIYVR